MLTSQGKLDSAETALGRALEIRRGHGGADTVMAGTLLDLADLANTKGEAARGDSLAHEALAILRRVAGERDLAVAAAMARVQSTQLGAGELAKAESTGRAAAAMLRELGLERHPQMVPILSDLSITLANRGELTEALAVAHQTVALDSALFGTAHPYLATHLENLGYVYDHAGFGDSAKMMVRAGSGDAAGAARGRQPRHRPDPLQPRVAGARHGVVRARPSRCTRRRCSGCGGPTGRSTPTWCIATGWLGRNQFYLGRRAEAERNIRWVLTVTDPHGAASPMDTVRFGRFLVTMLVDQRRWKEAEPLALRVFAIQDSLKDTLARVTAGHLATIYGATGQSEQAARYRGLADARP